MENNHQRKTRKDFVRRSHSRDGSRERDFLHRLSSSQLDLNLLSLEDFNNIPSLDNPRRRPTEQGETVKIDDDDVVKDIEVIYNQPSQRSRRRQRRSRSRSRRRRVERPEVTTGEDAPTSASLLKSPPSPPRSPPSPATSPPSPPRKRYQKSPPIQSLHVSRHVRARTNSETSAGVIAEEVAAQVVQLLAPKSDLLSTAEGVLEEVVVEAPDPLAGIQNIMRDASTQRSSSNIDVDEAVTRYQSHSEGAEIDDIGTEESEGDEGSILDGGAVPRRRFFNRCVSEPAIASTGTVGYCRYRRGGEGFLDVAFRGTDDENESGKNANRQVERITRKIVGNANEIKKLVITKVMGLPQAHSDHILRLADEIIGKHSEAEVLFIKKKYKKRQKPPEEKIKQIAERGEGVLSIVEKTRQAPQINFDGIEAAEHLEKMVKKLRCRHRQLRRLAEEIIAKRWKLQNMLAGKKGMPKQDGQTHTAREAAAIRRKLRKRYRRRCCDDAKSRSRKRTVNEKDVQLVYSNPMAKLKDIAKSYGGPETWREDDPLSKILNKVGVEIIEKCTNPEEHHKKSQESEAGLSGTGKKKRKIRLPHPVGVPFVIKRKTGVFPSPEEPDLEAHFQKTAVTLFLSNVSKLVVERPSSKEIDAEKKDSFRMMNIDKRELSNEFVDICKRKSYSVAIFMIIGSALLHCAYLCAPRMGDNYVTQNMVESLSGWPQYTPTGIYGMIFLGYLMGGMAVVKTAVAAEHNLTIKEYVKERKWKFILWYGLVLYFVVIWIWRSVYWYKRIAKMEKEIISVFKTKFYYNQLSNRLLYTQFLFTCCGANGPGDYPDGNIIGWPKSCYIRVDKYEEYFEEPKPIEYGCLSVIYVFNVMGVAVVCSITVLILILMIIQPIYLYVYELFICMRSKEPDPWLEERDD